MEATSGFEPLNGGFADPCLTTWLRRRFRPLPDGLVRILERKTRFELATSSLARRHSTAELLPLVLLVPRVGFEPTRAKRSLAPQASVSAIPPPRPVWQEWKDSNPRPAVLETAALPAELHSFSQHHITINRFYMLRVSKAGQGLEGAPKF